MALSLSYIGLTFLFERHVERRVEAEIRVYLDQVVSGLDRSDDGTLVMATSPADPRFSEPLSGLYWQLQVGNQLLRSRSLWDAKLALPQDVLADGAVHRHRIPGPDGSGLLALERSVTLPARLGSGAARAAVALDSREISAASRAFAADLLPYLAVIAILLISAGYAQVAIGLKPLDAVRKQLSQIRRGKARRLGQSFPDEIVPLTREVDALLEARETQVEKARARAGDLAHGFKTPLQVLTGDVERLRAKGEAEIADQVEQVATAMRRHVDRELARARMAIVRPDARARVSDVVQRVLAVVARTPAGGRLDWSVDIPEDAIARIDPDDLAEALGNLLENASKGVSSGPSGGGIRHHHHHG
ncbi:sensor histidine kinase [Chelativorans xinjiangense]|uniref:sensor histidine kinase n=1 Tax=Chelativorans xinjiangense TaxID=2681485 RepID=UPI001915956C|nr:HAMP domain-containing sensor histidine kinase [Chelativorans xinjiangense]